MKAAVLTFAVSILGVVSVPLTEADSPDLCYPWCQPPVWQSDQIRCFDLASHGWRGVESVTRFVSGGDISEPVLVSGQRISLDLFEGIAVFDYISVMNLVINADGRVEMIFATPFKAEVWGQEFAARAAQIDDRLVEAFSQWEFEPARLDGKPVCIRYNVVTRPRGLIGSQHYKNQ
jgi:hypothetical protein